MGILAMTSMSVRLTTAAVTKPAKTSTVDLSACEAGFKIADDEMSCHDINECIELTHDCNDTQVCENQDGGFQCVCPSGYQDNDGNGICLGACQSDTCSPYATCSDIGGDTACECGPDTKATVYCARTLMVVRLTRAPRVLRVTIFQHQIQVLSVVLVLQATLVLALLARWTTPTIVTKT